MEQPCRTAEVPGLVPRWSPTLARAIPFTGGSHTLEDAWLGALEGEHQVWAGEESILLTRVVDDASQRSVHIFLAAGDRSELVDRILPNVERWARSLGASEMTLAGRRGWVRALQDAGYREPKMIQLSKRL